jgi:hypothetical protein
METLLNGSLEWRMLKFSFLGHGSMTIAMVTGPLHLPAERLLRISSRRALFLGTGYCHHSTFGVGIKFSVHSANSLI